MKRVVSQGSEASNPAEKIVIQPEAVRRLPESFSSKHKIVPVEIKDEVLVVATASPISGGVMAEIAKAFGGVVKCLYLSEDEVEVVRVRAYGKERELDKVFA